MSSEASDKLRLIASILEVLRECNKLLTDYQKAMVVSLSAGNQQNEPPAIMFQRAFQFGVQTIAGVITLLEKDEDNAVLACTLCRPFYETAVRLLWASRTPGGWQRLQAYYANEDEKWAKDATKIASVANHARSILEHRREVLERTDETGNRYSPAPGMQQLLREIVPRDVVDGIRAESGDAAEFDYTNVYRLLCKAAHGHMVAIGRPSSFLTHAKYGTVMATWSLLQAYCHVGAEDPKKKIDTVGQRLLKIIENYRD